jgi:hypothetical protein
VSGSRLRLRCFGYVDEQIDSMDKAEQVMEEIEVGTIERPEIEIVQEVEGHERLIHVGALFREGGDERCLGWLLSIHDEPTRDNFAYCRANLQQPPNRLERVLFCGAPESIDESAILQRAEALELISVLVERGDHGSYVRKSFRDVFGWSL